MDFGSGPQQRWPIYQRPFTYEDGFFVHKSFPSQFLQTWELLLWPLEKKQGNFELANFDKKCIFSKSVFKPIWTVLTGLDLSVHFFSWSIFLAGFYETFDFVSKGILCVKLMSWVTGVSFHIWPDFLSCGLVIRGEMHFHMNREMLEYYMKQNSSLLKVTSQNFSEKWLRFEVTCPIFCIRFIEVHSCHVPYLVT